MWFYGQMWFPLLTVVLTAAVCLSVVSFIMGQAKPHPRFRSPDAQRPARTTLE